MALKGSFVLDGFLLHLFIKLFGRLCFRGCGCCLSKVRHGNIYYVPFSLVPGLWSCGCHLGFRVWGCQDGIHMQCNVEPCFSASRFWKVHTLTKLVKVIVVGG